VPPLLALVGFGYIVVSRPNFRRELLLAAFVAVMGTIVFLGRRVFRRGKLEHPVGD